MMIDDAVELEIPDDPALPGMHAAAQPDRILEFARLCLKNVPEDERRQWRRCRAAEAVYQPGRSCRIAYELDDDQGGRPTLVYARWPAERRAHTSATRIRSEGGGFDLFRYPRDRRLRQIRAMRRDDWLFEASQRWFRDWLGEGELLRDDWRCSPIKYVPESRLVCRLKGRWKSKAGERWVRGYIRMARQANVAAQFQLLKRLQSVLRRAGAPFDVPVPLGVIERHNLLAAEFVRGRTLREAVATGDTDALEDGCRRLAHLSLMPGATTPSDASFEPAVDSQVGDRVAAQQRMLDDLGCAEIACGAHLRTLRAWLRAFTPILRKPRPVHGDLHAGQVICKGDRCVVVDWDRFHLGDPTQDICNLAAEIEFIQALTGPANPGQALAMRAIQAWERAGGTFDPRTARWWFAHACVLRAWGLQRHLRPGWPEACAWLLNRAAGVSTQGLWGDAD